MIKGDFLMNFSSQETHYARVKKILSLFNQLTKTHISFIDTTLHLVTGNGLFYDPKKVTDFFYKKGSSLFFPLIINDKLNGMFICNKNTLPVNAAFLYQEALEAITSKIFKAYYQKVAILSPLTKDQLEEEEQLLDIVNSHFSGKTELENDEFNKPTDSDSNEETNNVDMALSYIEQNIDQKLTLVNVAKNSYLSPAYLSRLFKEYFKINFSNYIRTRKIALAQKQLILTDESIDKISKKVGFSRANYFNKVFKETANLTPLQFRKRYNGVKKVYTIPRELDWNDNISVYAVSHHYFQKMNVMVKEQTINGFPYVSSINGLSSLNNTNGWIYLIDGIQPSTLPSETYVKDKSVIQWVYINL